MALTIHIHENHLTEDHTECFHNAENGIKGPASSLEPKFDVDYGKFYKQSYLDLGNKPLKRGPPLSPTNQSPTHLHRPDNFSYQHVKRDFSKPAKKRVPDQGGKVTMLSALGAMTNLLRDKTEREISGPISRQEAIRLAHFPEGHRSESRMTPLERMDWPSPLSAAAAYPELLRDKKSRKTEEEEEEKKPDPETKRNIEELEKLQDSGVGQALLKDLEKKQSEPEAVDPVSCSRSPAADKEPPYKTRYESHVDASPSRLVDKRVRTHSLDDNLLDRAYDNQTLLVGNIPVPKPGYSLGPKSATLPVSDSKAFSYSAHGADLQNRSSSHSTSKAPLREYDPETGLRRSRNSESACDGFSSSFLASRSSGPSVFKVEDPPKIYAYDELRLSKAERPAGTDRNTLECHLDPQEFEVIFNMKREQFYRLPEWKQNDLKRRVELF